MIEQIWELISIEKSSFTDAFNITLLVALLCNWRSSNLRWMILGILGVRILDHFAYEPVMNFNGSLFYLYVFTIDVLYILVIFQRPRTARWFVEKTRGGLRAFFSKTIKQYSVYRQELSILAILVFSMLVSLASLFEWSIREFTSFHPSFVYYSYYYLKSFILCIFIIALISITIENWINRPKVKAA